MRAHTTDARSTQLSRDPTGWAALSVVPLVLIAMFGVTGCEDANHSTGSTWMDGGLPDAAAMPDSMAELSLCTPQEAAEEDHRLECREVIPDGGAIRVVVQRAVDHNSPDVPDDAEPEELANLTFQFLGSGLLPPGQSIVVEGRVSGKMVAQQHGHDLPRAWYREGQGVQWATQHEQPSAALMWDRLRCYPVVALGINGFLLQVQCDEGDGHRIVFSALLPHFRCAGDHPWREDLQMWRPLPEGYEPHVVIDRHPEHGGGTQLRPRYASNDPDAPTSRIFHVPGGREDEDCSSSGGYVHGAYWYSSGAVPYVVTVQYPLP